MINTQTQNSIKQGNCQALLGAPITPFIESSGKVDTGALAHYKETHAIPNNYAQIVVNSEFGCRSSVCHYAACQKSLRFGCDKYLGAIAAVVAQRAVRESAGIELANAPKPRAHTDKDDLREFYSDMRRPGAYVAFGKEAENCGRWGMLKECGECGSKMVKRLYCGREWCPTCGADNSERHKRRISRFAPRVFAMASVGYFVFEVNLCDRRYFEDAGFLNDAARYIERLLVREFPGTRGVGRWHYYGDPELRELFGVTIDCKKYHPHFNVLLELGWIGKKRIKRLRRLWSNWLKQNCKRGYYKTAPVHYSYCKAERKRYHLIRYITRATFKLLNDGNKHIARELFKFRNCRWFGKFSKAEQKRGEELYNTWLESLPEREALDKVSLEAHRCFDTDTCPICGAPLTLAEGVIRVDKYEIKHDYGGGLLLVVGDG